jgi:hypothetical protein
MLSSPKDMVPLQMGLAAMMALLVCALRIVISVIPAEAAMTAA